MLFGFEAFFFCYLLHLKKQKLFLFLKTNNENQTEIFDKAENPIVLAKAFKFSQELDRASQSLKKVLLKPTHPPNPALCSTNNLDLKFYDISLKSCNFF
jgi:hypothetical protein